ncbi:MAG: DNA mismatch repair protein [Geoglossum umbratile]|nr:MAG: DNA mismatch repair protein [Geoglossum umbratile]
MTSAASTILPLPAEVVAQIKSSATITSLSGVILGLLSNSLDARAAKVEIGVDFRRGGCTVEDDGAGIQPDEFREDGGLGKMYYTSKFDVQTKTHGHNGTFLSSLAALSFVTITSHHHLHRSHNTLGLHQSKVITRLTPSPAHQYLSFWNHGTRVTVRDLFGNMPVRVKQRALSSVEQGDYESEWEELKRGIVGLLLGEGRGLSVVVRDTEKDRKFSIRPPSSGVPSGDRNFCELRSNTPMSDLPLTRSILSQASYVPQGSWDSWVPLSATTPYLSIHGSISLNPSPTKRVQFISLGIHPVGLESGNNMLYEEVNRLFAASDFGVIDDDLDIDESEKERRQKDRRYKSDGYTNKQLRGGHKGVDRWPMFSLRVNLEGQGGARLRLGEEELMRSDSDLRSVLELLGVVTTEFLTANHFRPRARRTKVPTNNPEQDYETDEPGDERSIKWNKDTLRSSNPVLHHAGSSPSTKTRFTILQQPSPDSHTSSKGDSSSRGSGPLALKPDALGNNVKLPTFSRSTAGAPDPVINSWTRVKSGKRSFLEDGCGAAPARSRGPIKTSDNPSPESELGSLSATNKASVPQGDLRLRGTLKTPRPQSRDGGGQGNDDLTEDPDFSEREGGSPPMLGEDSTTDGLIPWVNPATNRHFLINSRTGMASVASKDSEGDRPGTSSTHGMFDSLAHYKRLKLRSDASEKAAVDPNSWIGGLLKDWNNPVFRQTEEGIPQVALVEGTSAESSNILHGRHHYCSQVEIEKAFKESTSGFPERLSKESLRDAEVIAQVDKKFILVKIAASTESGDQRGGATEKDLLAIIDQHAADERCRIESLLRELCTPPSPELQDFTSLLGFTSRIATSILPKPVTFHVSPQEHRLFNIYAQHFANWGILYDLLSPAAPSRARPEGEHSIVVKTLPAGIMEKCRAEAKLLLGLLRGEVWGKEDGGMGNSKGVGVFEGREGVDWWRVIGGCPKGILDMLNSRACRSAIMFNDELSLDECRALVSRLVECKLPFQCAHGRPSMIPLVDLRAPAGGSIEKGTFGGGGWEEEDGGFMEAARRWRVVEGM